METVIDQTRLEEVLKINLRNGTGPSLDKQICVMQAVDYVSTGGLSDHPECACPALTSYAIKVNDRVDDETRQKLKPLIPKFIGTRDGQTKERAEVLVHHSITEILPLLTDALKMAEDSEKLRSFKIGEWKEMRAFCTDLRPRIRQAMRAYAYAADAAAADAAAYAAAAYDAAYAAAYAAAAYDAAYAAAAAAADAAAAYDAYADAYAYAAADAAAYAAAAYDAAYAAAADAAADAAKKAFWQQVRKDVWNKMIEGLEKVLEIRKD